MEEEETTMDREEEGNSAFSSPSILDLEGLSSEFLAISPFEWKRRREPHHPSESGDGRGGGGGGGGGMFEGSGMSGLLSFLGDSPDFFDRTGQSSGREEGKDDDDYDEGMEEVERNLLRSAEKVRRLEEHLLRSAGAGGAPSPVQPPPTTTTLGRGMAGGRTRGAVTFAIADGLETPRGGVGAQSPSSSPSSRRRRRRQFPRSPYYKYRNENDDENDEGGMTTSMLLDASMEAVANPANESVIVSDDEACSGSEFGGGEPSPLKGIGSDIVVGVGGGGGLEEEEEMGARDDDRRRGGDENGRVYAGAGSTGGDDGRTTPSRAALMERNQTLVREVRFADQTCVALAERKKFYKNQAGQCTKSLRIANEDIASLRTNHESSMKESAQLKVLVESLQGQVRQANAQVDAYRTQIADSEKTHRSSLKKMEKTYFSHLRNAEEQINGLNDRLQESQATNANLQSKVDDVHGRWESTLQSDASSRELISSLKERVASGDATAANATRAMRERVADLQQLCDQQKSQLQMERCEREMVEQERDDLRAQCDDLHGQLTDWAQTSDAALHDVFFDEEGGSPSEDVVVAPWGEYDTPAKHPRLEVGSDDVGGGPRTPGNRTPTANLLARTLRSELKRRQTVSEKLHDAERQVANLEGVVRDMKMECEEAKALAEELEEKDDRIAQLELTMGAKDDQIEMLIEEVEALRRVDGDASSTDNDEGRSLSRSQSGSGIESQPRSNSNCESRSRSVRDTPSVLEERLDALEGTLEFTDDELKETSARLADAQELLDQTAGELERAEEELAGARDRASDYEAQVDKLFKELTEKEVEHADLFRFSHFQKSTIETITDKLSHSERVNVELRTQLESCFQALVALEKILRTYEDLEGVAGRMISEQCRKVGRLLETIKQFSPRADVTSTTPRDMGSIPFSEPDFESPSMFSNFRREHQIKEDLDDANVQLREARKLLREYREELSENESEHNRQTSTLKKQRDEFESELSFVSSENQRINNELEESNQQLQNTKTLVQQYQDELSNQENRRVQEIETKFNMELDVINGQLQQANKLLDEYQDELRHKEIEHERETSSLRWQFDELDVKLSSVAEQLQQANKILEEYRDKLRNQESEHEQETSSLQKKCDELNANLSSVTSEMKTCKKEHKSSLKTAAAAENAVSQQLSVMRSNNTELMKENESLRVYLQSLELQLEDEKSLLRATQEAADGKRQDVLNAKAAFECISTECDITKKTLSKVEKQAHVLRDLVNEKERELKECRESQSKAQESLKEQIGSLKSLCSDLETRLSVEELGRLSAEASLDDAHVHIAMVENALEVKETESQEKESECHQLLIQVKEIQNALAEAERERAEADIAIERLEDELQEKKSIIFAYEESIISYKGDIRRLDNELQTTILEKNSRIQMLEQACNSRHALFSEQLDRTKKERDSSTAELTDMIKRLQNELLESNRLYQESGERAKSTFVDLNKVHQVLEEGIVEKQAHLDEITQKYNDSCQELEKAQLEIDQMSDKMNSFEIDYKRLATRHQDEIEELVEQKNRMHDERVQLEKQM
jgi:chromosome segregation ATPase